MKAVFEKLKSLQDILLKQFILEKEIEEIPIELNELKNKFQRTKRNIDEKGHRKEQYSKRLVELKKEKEQLNSDEKKYESQIPLIKTQKEYEAITNEIAQVKEKKEKLEEEELLSYESLEDINRIIEEESSIYSELEETIEVKEKEVVKLLEEKQKELDKYLKEKYKISKGMEEDVIHKFEKIVKIKEGIGIVSIKNNVCMGCNMILPPQFVNDVRREKEIIFCPNCSRILYYYDKDMEDVKENYLVL